MAKTYWCRFFDLGGRALGGENLAVADDADVIAKARVTFATGLIGA